jgi:hypothetical protein
MQFTELGSHSVVPWNSGEPELCFHLRALALSLKFELYVVNDVLWGLRDCRLCTTPKMQIHILARALKQR